MRTDAFVWAPAYVQNRQVTPSETALAAKARSLRTVKDRWVGRQDLATMADVEMEISEDDLELRPPTLNNAFVSADDEEDEVMIGQEMTGTIFEINEEGAFLEMGGKMSGFLPAEECSLQPMDKFEALFEIGQEITATVIGYERRQPVLSLRDSLLEVAWQEIMNKRSTDEPFEVTLLEVSKGGAVCDAFGMRVFLPGSQMSSNSEETNIPGQKIAVKILDIDEDGGRVIISQRKLTGEAAAKSPEPGDVVTAKVTGTRNYGAFVELPDGSTGLLHISQVSNDRVENVETLFTAGQEIKVLVLSFDRMNNRVAVSTKALEAKPGDMLRDMSSVFITAEDMGKAWRETQQRMQQAREASGAFTVTQIAENLGGDTAKALEVVSSIDSLLNSVAGGSNN